jgi:SAM-dependent methyltransferase
MKSNWQADFFRGVALEFWRRAMSPEHTRAEADVLEKALYAPPGAQLLDVPCGSGRHAMELAGRGYLLTGVDSSEEFIAEARGSTAHPIRWILGDMRELPWTEEFHGAYCCGNSFGYLDPAGARKFLGAVARTLKPGGRFVMDTGMAAESIFAHAGQRPLAPAGRHDRVEREPVPCGGEPAGYRLHLHSTGQGGNTSVVELLFYDGRNLPDACRGWIESAGTVGLVRRQAIRVGVRGADGGVAETVALMGACPAIVIDSCGAGLAAKGKRVRRATTYDGAICRMGAWKKSVGAAGLALPVRVWRLMLFGIGPRGRHCGTNPIGQLFHLIHVKWKKCPTI